MWCKCMLHQIWFSHTRFVYTSRSWVLKCKFLTIYSKGSCPTRETSLGDTILEIKTWVIRNSSVGSSSSLWRCPSSGNGPYYAWTAALPSGSPRPGSSPRWKNTTTGFKLQNLLEWIRWTNPVAAFKERSALNESGEGTPSPPPNGKICLNESSEFQPTLYSWSLRSLGISRSFLLSGWVP